MSNTSKELKELREQIAETISLTRSRNVAEERVLDSIIELVESWHTRKLNEARIDEIRRTRPYLTYPGMVYYGERMNELRGAETEEVK